MDLDQLLPKLFVGSHPETTHDIDRLKQDLGVTAVLNLQTDEDIRCLNLDWDQFEDHYRRAAIKLRRIPVRDFEASDLRKRLPDCVEALARLLQDGHSVYVHCSLGVARAPSVVVAYLHWVRNWDLNRAVKDVSTRRRCSPNADAVRLASEDRFRARESDAC